MRIIKREDKAPPFPETQERLNAACVGRLAEIDRAKGILIVLVVIGHIWQSGYLFNTIYTFHMPAFFVISGILFGVSRS